MSLFDKFGELEKTLTDLQGNRPAPIGISTDRLYSVTEGEIAGRRTILAGTNNYLGLTFNPEIIAAAKQALDTFGTGSTGSRMASGTYAEHLTLEKDLALFFGKASVIVFSTGYQANLAVISTLANADDVILMDADSHASIYDGARLSGAELYRFKHNDPADLDKRLQRLGSRAKDALIILEGLYSMLGDKAALQDFVEVKKKYGSYLLVDEAHSLGVLGPEGRGLAAELGVLEDIDFVVGTFSKSLGCIGGYCASDLMEMELARNAMRPYMFTASSTPAVIAGARAALVAVRQGAGLRKRLWQHAHRMYDALKITGFQVGPEASPIIAVKMASARQAAEAWGLLFELGVYVNLIVPPATPSSMSLLRCSICAEHTNKQIDHIIAAYQKVATDICGL